MTDKTLATLDPDEPEPGKEVVKYDTSYEVALDPEPDLAPVQVDPVTPAGARIPVVPLHLRTPAGVRAAVGRHAGELAHRGAYHAVRSPGYLLLAACWAVVGVFRLLGRQLRWWWVTHAVALEFQAAKDRDGREFRSVHKQVKDTRRFRGYVLGAEAVALCAAAGLMVVFAQWWGWLLLACLLLPLLARAGRPADRRIMHPAVVTPRFRKLNSDIVLRAYQAAKLHDPVKPDYQVTFASTMARDGEGSGVDVDLPHGKGLKDAMDARPALASGLDVQISQVFLHRDPTSYRRHHLWVADRDPLAVPVGKTPLLACKPADIWKPAPLGLDERGQIVKLLLLWASVLVGALPRQGKTWTARMLALFAALDPYVKLDVFDAAGKPDWRKFALVADSCAFGLTPTRDGLPPEILLATLEGIKSDVQDRYNRLSALPTSICPEGKLTREIARDPRFNMPVRVLILDEFQEYYDLGEISKQIAELLRFLVKVAPAAGVIPIWATQKPSGIGGSGALSTMFNATRDNFGVRFALRTSSYDMSEAVLGRGTYGMGLDSSVLLAQYKGVGILYGATDESPTVRGFTANDQDAEKILLAARGLRERAGTLSGMALGEEVSAPVRDVLADALAAFGADPKLHWQILAARMAKRFPDRYEDITADTISAQLRDLGVPPRQVKMFGQNLNGCWRADIEALREGRQ